MCIITHIITKRWFDKCSSEVFMSPADTKADSGSALVEAKCQHLCPSTFLCKTQPQTSDQSQNTSDRALPK